MQQKRTRSSRPKLFQCKGYGDCNMIFTRSEHLARHARKHTGEKPFVCIVPECKKAFSRFDNMMQHTQTHRNNNHYNIVNSHPKDRHHKDGPGDNTRSNTKAQTRQPSHKKSTSTTATAACEQQQQQQTDTKKKSCCAANNSYMNNELYIQTHGQQQPSPSGLFSPVSLSSSSPKRQIFSCTSSSTSSEEEEEEDEEDAVIRTPPLKRTRRLSVADLCNPTNDAVPSAPTTSIHNLTKDEFEALEGFGRFRHSPTVFFDPLKDLAHVSKY
ncbi:C2H2-type zinc finger transcription factor [Mucor lusitanicus]|uniref:C2H2-type zinc finger transcription factor n=2 Tax=Mucor circinelloides f. lusitanicus TaxID=29924 RepID=A0A162QJ43_MUCCL|nr:C2H2-type zinc finger transcription factor [Mucor lusitanicus]OAD02470.1 C2H2-type zinc finger transcription factor [Mucor lusitanicus CBS 277.49]